MEVFLFRQAKFEAKWGKRLKKNLKWRFDTGHYRKLEGFMRFIFLFSIFFASLVHADGTKPTAKQIAQGKKVIKTTCVACHSGTNWATYSFKQGGTAKEIFQTVSNGLGNMQPLKDVVPEEDRWNAAYAIESMHKK